LWHLKRPFQTDSLTFFRAMPLLPFHGYVKQSTISLLSPFITLAELQIRVKRFPRFCAGYRIELIQILLVLIITLNTTVVFVLVTISTTIFSAVSTPFQLGVFAT
jgi:hypothetical protein